MIRTPSAFLPTDEQLETLDLIRSGASCALEALAGTGKTATLLMAAEQMPHLDVRYVAFNRSIVEEAQQKFPVNVAASTAHSLAMRAVGYRYQHRLGRDARRLTSREIASRLKLPRLFEAEAAQGRGDVRIPSWQLAGYVMRTIVAFCQTADLEPTTDHVPRVITLEPANESRMNARFAERILPFVKTAWADNQSIDGQLRFEHSHYLKMWQLSNPTIDADVILFDEAQDADPVMSAVVEAQDAQRVYVGDTRQQIYSWRGAVNALEGFDVGHRAWLTNSFRFGPAVAEIANVWLSELASPQSVKGRGGPSYVSAPPDGDVTTLTRTNAVAISHALVAIAEGRKPHLIGNTEKEFIWFAEGAAALMRGDLTSHPELACFTTWQQVVQYAEEDMLGGDLKLSVDIIEEFGADRVVSQLGRCQKYEEDADVVLSTAHKSKGREWRAVRIAHDFRTPWDDDDREVSDEELRLNYVAVTRAREYIQPGPLEAQR